MRIWQAGDIISDEKWEALNNVVPRFKKVEWYNENDGILDISQAEFDQLLNNDCQVWTINPTTKYVMSLSYGNGYSIESTSDDRIQLTYQEIS